MSIWQNIICYFLIVFYPFHLIRDLLQDFGYQNILSQTLVKHTYYIDPNYSKWLWLFFNTYIIEIIGIVTISYCLYKKSFGFWGWFNIVLILTFWLVWGIYYFWM